MGDRIAAPGAPLDAALPALARAADAAHMRDRLAAALGASGDLQIEVLKHTPGKRCVLAYRFAGGMRAVGKLYRKDRSARHAAVLAELERTLQGAVRAPRLLLHEPALGLVVQEWMPGEPVPEFAALLGRERLIERLGSALAALHAVEIEVAPRADFEAHLRRTCHPGLETLGAALPDVAPVIGAVQSAMRARAAHVAHDVRTCHGDFSPRQLLVTDAQVSVVDLDGLSRSDPALDVAWFQVGLRAHLGPAGEVPADGFLAAYRAAFGTAALPGLEACTALGWMRRALIVWRKRPADWEAVARAAVARAAAALEV